MKVLNLQIENVKKIRALDITPEGNAVIISGRNGAGKSTVLDAIYYALTGKVSDDPIRKGETKATIRIKTEEFYITKIITPRSTQLKIEKANGEKIASPQRFLDSLVGDLSFDPLAFSTMKSKDQRATLLQLAGVDFSDLDSKITEVSELRTEIGRDLKKTEGALQNATGDFSGLPEQEIVISELLQKIQKERDEEAEKNRLTGEYQARCNRINEIVTRKKRNNEEILRLQKENEALSIDYSTQIRLSSSVTEKIKGINFSYTDLEQQLKDAEMINSRIRSRENFLKLQSETSALKDNYETKTVKITALRQQKVDRLNAAEMPITGLSVSDEGVTFNGFQFSELSTAQQIKVSLAIAMKMNPTAKIIQIKDGSLLDSDNLKIIERMAADQDYQVWIEKVSDGPDKGIYIEDGEIA